MILGLSKRKVWKFMAARKKQEGEINLLPQKGFQSSTAGRILAWILSTFRIIVIVTEIIVMVAFLSRFWFDAQNSSLNEQIQQKQAVLLASQDFEQKFKDAQKRLDVYSGLTQNRYSEAHFLETLKTFVPPDVIATQISYSEGNIFLTGLTSNERSIQQFIANIKSDVLFSNVELSGISSDPESPNLLKFIIKIDIATNPSS